MATKNSPGAFDCYAKAEPDEPMFILLARDLAASQTIHAWITARIRSGKNRPDDPQIAEARECANAMLNWRAAQLDIGRKT